MRTRRLARAAALAAVGVASAAAVPAATAAEPCANAKYRTGPSLNLPDCRAYEMVTPPDKYDQIQNWSTVANFPAPSGYVAPSGDRMLYVVSSGRLAENPASGAIGSLERAYRTPSGWRIQRTVAPPVEATYTAAGVIPKGVLPSVDASRVAFNGSAPFSPFQAPFGMPPDYYGGAFLSDGSSNTWLSRPTWAGAAPAQGTDGAHSVRWRVAGASESLDSVYFMSTATHTPLDGESGRPMRTSWAVYRWEGGEMVNAGVLPDGTVSPGGSIPADMQPGGDAVTGTAALFTLGSEQMEARSANAVSADGRSLLFVSPDPERNASAPAAPTPQLYLSRAGEPPLLLSQPFDGDGPVGQTPVVDSPGLELVGVLGAQTGRPGSYALATADHSVVFFATTDALTGDAPGGQPDTVKTYRYEAADDSLTYIAELDHPVLGGAGNPPGLYDDEKGNLVSLSADGDSLLYITGSGQLRLWRNGAPSVLVSENMTNAATTTALPHLDAIRWSADGSVILLQSNAPLRGEPHHVVPTASLYQAHIYRYVVADDDLSCVTCRAGNESAKGASLTAAYQGSFKGGAATQMPARSMTPAGDMFVFVTDMALSARDHNAVNDVYRWKDGDIDLISTGASGAAAQMMYDISEDGSSVFLMTRDKLVPWDVDKQYDVYVARVDGGFDAPDDGHTQVCAGDDCQGDAAAASAVAPASEAATGAGNAKSVRARLAVALAGSGRTARLAVRVSEAGRLRVAGRHVRPASRKVAGGGRVELRLRLDRSGAAALARRGKVSTRVRVVFRTASGRTVARRVAVRFKASARAKRPMTGNRGGEAR